MLNQNPLYGIIDLSYVQRQLIMQQMQVYHVDGQWQNNECARKLDDFLKCVSEVAPEYQLAAISTCCIVAEKYMGPRKNFIPQV